VANNDSVIAISSHTANILKAFRGDLWLARSKERDTPLAIGTQEDVPEGFAHMNRTVQKNLQVEPGDCVAIEPLANIRYAKRIAIRPLADTVHGVNMPVFDNFFAPYFQWAYRPARTGDCFTCPGAEGMVEFEYAAVDSGDSSPYGIVAQDTVIHYDGKPVQRNWHKSAS
jgi:transitional endoplasmic reticulum ATPase